MVRFRRRQAFTLVELLVVVGIIGILLALTATAVFGVRKGQQKSNSEATLNKLDGKLQQKLNAIRDQIDNDMRNNQAEAPAVLVSCSNNKDMAKAVMMYARTRQQLPMTFTEANIAAPPNNYFTVCGYRYYSSPVFRDLPVSGTSTIEESAACFYAAVAQLGLEGLENQQGTNSTGQKVFTDSFGSPIGFVRLGYDGNQNELNKPTRMFDPFYPNKTGAGAYRNMATEYDMANGAGSFNSQVWNVVRVPVTWVASPATYPGLKNHTAFVFSAGSNKLFTPEPPSNTIFDGDNLFSYRLRQEGAGGE